MRGKEGSKRGFDRLWLRDEKKTGGIVEEVLDYCREQLDGDTCRRILEDVGLE